MHGKTPDLDAHLFFPDKVCEEPTSYASRDRWHPTYSLNTISHWKLKGLDSVVLTTSSNHTTKFQLIWWCESHFSGIKPQETSSCLQHYYFPGSVPWTNLSHENKRSGMWETAQRLSLTAGRQSSIDITWNQILILPTEAPPERWRNRLLWEDLNTI